MTATANPAAPAELTAVLAAAGTDWDDLRCNVEFALAEHYDATYPGEPVLSDMMFSEAAERWAARVACAHLVPLNPTKDV